MNIYGSLMDIYDEKKKTIMTPNFTRHRYAIGAKRTAVCVGNVYCFRCTFYWVHHKTPNKEPQKLSVKHQFAI